MKKTLIALYICLCLGCNKQPVPNPTPSESPLATPTQAEPVKSPKPAETAPASGTFQKSLELQGITFEVSCPNDSSLNQLTITPSGLTEVNEVLSMEADGTVTEAEVADINSDGSPEVYIYVTSAGSGAYGSCVAYSTNDKKSLTQINIPPVSSVEGASEGYMGHDEFRVVETSLVQRWPIYKEGDSNDNPTGGTRQIQWKLEPGEAMWQMKADKVETY